MKSWWINWTQDVEKRITLQRRFTDTLKEDIQRFGVIEEDAKYRVRWREMICLKGAAERRR